MQDQRIDTEYNGWWACLIPAAVVRAIGYPLPLFFQWDDIEFGYRARAHGFPSVALPGAGVWHADFGWKDWDEWHRYFNMRNGLITAALHTPFSVRRIGRTLGMLLGQYLVAMQYGLAATLIQAVDDFLDGPGCCVTARRPPRPRSAGSVRRTPRRRCGRSRRSRATSARCRSSARPNEPGHEVLTWLKRAAYHLTDRAVHPTGMVVAGDAHWWHVSMFRRAVVTDMSEQGLRVRTRDRARAVALARRGARSLARLATEGPEWRRGTGRRWAPGSRENWARLYERENWARLTGSLPLDATKPGPHPGRELCASPATFVRAPGRGTQLSKICFQPSRLVRCGAASR